MLHIKSVGAPGVGGVGSLQEFADLGVGVWEFAVDCKFRVGQRRSSYLR